MGWSCQSFISTSSATPPNITNHTQWGPTVNADMEWYKRVAVVAGILTYVRGRRRGRGEIKINSAVKCVDEVVTH